MDLSRGNEKAIGVFISGSDNKQLGWILRETIFEVQRMGRSNGRLQDKSDNFQGERSLIAFK